MTGTRPPIDPESLAEQMGDLPKAGDRLRLVGLDHVARMQQARVGAANARLALAQARRPDDGETIAGSKAGHGRDAGAAEPRPCRAGGRDRGPARTSGTA